MARQPQLHFSESLPLQVLVLKGGPGAEREVSLQSGSAVGDALRENTEFQVIEETIDHSTIEQLDDLPGDVIFPVLHGSWGEGGPLQAMLEELGRPFVGSGSEAAALAMDKLRTKTLLTRCSIDTPVALELHRDDVCRLQPPLVLKPIDDGSSVDIRVCKTDDDVASARGVLHDRRGRIMAEQFVPGRELTVSIVQGKALPVIEIVPHADFYDYDAKYDRDDTKYIVEPDISPAVARTCVEAAMIAFEEIGCRDLARADFRVDPDDKAWFLEINTMPGFTAHSLLPMAAAHVGLPMPKLCASLVLAAAERTMPRVG